MKSFREMSPAELRHTLQILAWGIARSAFLQRFPRKSARTAETWATAHWKEFEDRAVDLVALLEARREAEAADNTGQAR